jgi:hypothetical protein
VLGQLVIIYKYCKKGGLAGCGIQTAALASGGYTGTVETGATELYDGTSWATSPASLNTARQSTTGAGTQTAALTFGGLTTVSSIFRSNRRI